MGATKKLYDFDGVNANFVLGKGVNVKTARLHHPAGATGYRVEKGGVSVCYFTDTEHRPDKPDDAILDLIEGADLVVYDSTYTDAEFPEFVGWGHSTWQEGVRLCRAANVKQMAIFHHDPAHVDSFMADVEAQARQVWNGTFVARNSWLSGSTNSCT